MTAQNAGIAGVAVASGVSDVDWAAMMEEVKFYDNAMHKISEVRNG